MYTKFALLISALLLVIGAGPAAAGEPDRYIGDTSIYSGTSTTLKPNVLILVDTSKNMGQGGGTEPYNPNTTYPGSYTSDAIYLQLNANNYQEYASDVNAATVCPDAYTALTNYGFYNKGLKRSSGACSDKSNDVGNYYLGNLLNKTQSAVAAPADWEADTPYSVGDIVTSTDSSNPNTYKCIGAGTSAASEPAWPTDPGSTVTDGGVTWEITATLMEVVKSVLSQASGALREDLRLGVATVGPNNAGGWVRTEVKDVSSTTIDADGNVVANTTGQTNYSDFLAAIDNLNYISSNTAMPMNEAVHDMMYYYMGENDDTDKMASGASVYSAPSPIQYSCQKNYVLMLTTGSSTASPQAESAVGDPNSDGLAGRTDDAAKLGYETDLLADDPTKDETEGYQRMQTSVIQLMTSKVDELEQATNGSHGRGDYFLANNTEELTEALLGLLNNIVREAETAFVAPVVPASPENRTYSGKRIYIGFFKPISQQPWYGNLKKFGINEDLQIVSANGTDPATNADGTFNAGATSFWSPAGDAGDVMTGGVGGKLMARDFSTDPRQLWTWTGDGTKTAMTDAENQITTSNAEIDATLLGLSDATEVPKLVKYLHGLDGYNDNGNGDTVKREWVLGDILHSKPLVVNFKKYVFNTSNEADPSINKTFIFQGANDGMLHCFRDADGREEWAFIPPDLLPRLQNLRDSSHSFFVDGTPSIYIHDANNDMDIVEADGDVAVLMFGLRRGGGLQSLTDAGFRGGYYFLDVTDPTAPEYLGKVTNTSTGFGEMGQSWSQPRLARVKVNGQRKIVAFIAGGYDNVEDLRWGSTQTYPADTTTVPTPIGPPDSFTTGQSADGYSRDAPRGRGIYAIEIATLIDDGNGNFSPSFANRGTLVWGMVHGATSGISGNLRTSPDLEYSFASDLLAIDRDINGQVDRIYSGDTGGNLWRFNVGDDDVSNWDAKKVFAANPGTDKDSVGNTYTTVGRKFFYKPDLTIVDSDSVMLYFGSGDRAHPMNHLSPGPSGAVIDRLYAVRDSDDHAGTLTEADLHDVTENKLQQDASAAEIEAERDALFAADNYGWYIRLDPNPGEKALAPVSVFNEVVFYTTYQPDSQANIAAADDPCDPGNLGFSRMYAVHYQTGEAVFNFDTTNGTDIFGENQTSATNERSEGEDKEGNAYILRRADREMSLGGGIPSGMVFVIGADGRISAITAANISFPALTLPGDGTIFPVYWTQW